MVGPPSALFLCGRALFGLFLNDFLGCFFQFRDPCRKGVDSVRQLVDPVFDGVDEVADAVSKAKAGQVQYRTDRAGIIHCPLGKADFEVSALRENLDALIADREAQGLSIEADFVGVREVTLADATFDRDTSEAELTVRFVGELTSVVRNAEGEIVEGNPTEIKRQRDVWTFARDMGADDPNWQLVATGE